MHRTITLIGIIYLVLLYLAYEAMNRDLCARHFSPARYAEMQLDCKEYQ